MEKKVSIESHLCLVSAQLLSSNGFVTYQDDICKKYGIRSKSKLQIWIKKYNGHEELKASPAGGTVIMTKGRKTTFEERVEIASYLHFP